MYIHQYTDISHVISLISSKSMKRHPSGQDLSDDHQDSTGRGLLGVRLTVARPQKVEKTWGKS